MLLRQTCLSLAKPLQLSAQRTPFGGGAGAPLEQAPPPMAADPMMAPLPRGYGHPDEDRGKDHDGQTASMQSSTELTSSVSLQTLSLLDSLDEALGGLESEDVHDRALAARRLTKLVEGVYGEDAAAVGGYVRDSGAIEMLLELVLASFRFSAANAPRKQPTAPYPRIPFDQLSSADATVLADAVCRLRTPFLMSTRRC